MAAPPASDNKGSLSVVRPTNAGTDGMFEAFICITAEGSVTAFNGHVDLGTGIRTALGQIVAEELDVSFARVVVVLGDTTQTPNQFSLAYYGDSPATLVEARCTQGLLSTKVPLMFTVSEMDPKDFQDQAAQVSAAWHAAKGVYPPMEYMAGHNHLSPAQCIGSSEDDLGPRIARFIAVACAAG